MNRQHMQELRKIVQRHVDTGGIDTPLNGVSRDFNMNLWECRTSACALGSYVLSDYGKQFLAIPDIEYGDGYIIGARHFDISENESRWLFDPDQYRDMDKDGEPFEPEFEEEDDEPNIEPHEVLARIDKLLENEDES